MKDLSDIHTSGLTTEPQTALEEFLALLLRDEINGPGPKHVVSKNIKATSRQNTANIVKISKQKQQIEGEVASCWVNKLERSKSTLDAIWLPFPIPRSPLLHLCRNVFKTSKPLNYSGIAYPACHVNRDCTQMHTPKSIPQTNTHTHTYTEPLVKAPMRPMYL